MVLLSTKGWAWVQAWSHITKSFLPDLTNMIFPVPRPSICTLGMVIRILYRMANGPNMLIQLSRHLAHGGLRPRTLVWPTYRPSTSGGLMMRPLYGSSFKKPQCDARFQPFSFHRVILPSGKKSNTPSAVGSCAITTRMFGSASNSSNAWVDF